MIKKHENGGVLVLGSLSLVTIFIVLALGAAIGAITYSLHLQRIAISISLVGGVTAFADPEESLGSQASLGSRLAAGQATFDDLMEANYAAMPISLFSTQSVPPPSIIIKSGIYDIDNDSFQESSDLNLVNSLSVVGTLQFNAGKVFGGAFIGSGSAFSKTINQVALWDNDSGAAIVIND